MVRQQLVAKDPILVSKANVHRKVERVGARESVLGGQLSREVSVGANMVVESAATGLVVVMAAKRSWNPRMQRMA